MGAVGVKLPPFERFSTGLLCGTIFALALAAAIDSEVEVAFREKAVELFGIVAALVAAVVSLFGVQKQIRLQQSQAYDLRMSDLRAATAVLPLVLTEFLNVSEDCFEDSIREMQYLSNPDNRLELLNHIEVNQNTIETLKDCIRNSDSNSAQWLILIVKKYQVCASRMKSFIEHSDGLINDRREELAVDWLEFRAIVEHVFGFARGEVLSVPSLMAHENVRPYIGARFYQHLAYQRIPAEIARRLPRYNGGSPSDYF